LECPVQPIRKRPRMTSRLKSAVRATDAIGQLLQRGMSDIPNLTQWSGFSNAETPPTECGSIRTWRPALRNLKSYRIDHHSSLGLAKLAFPDEIRGPLNLRKRRHVPSGVRQRQDCRPLTPFAQVGSFLHKSAATSRQADVCFSDSLVDRSCPDKKCKFGSHRQREAGGLEPCG
jgi:hypothetical protein